MRGVQVFHRLEDDVAAFAAIAAIRAAERDEFLAPEGGDAVAAIAGFEIDFRLVEKFHDDIKKGRVECPALS